MCSVHFILYIADRLVQLQYELNFPPTLLFATGTGGSGHWPFVSNYSALLQPFPANIHLLSLIQLNSSTTEYLLRVVNIYEAGDDPVFSQPTTIALADYVKAGTIVSMNERTLTAVCPLMLCLRFCL